MANSKQPKTQNINENNIKKYIQQEKSFLTPQKQKRTQDRK